MNAREKGLIMKLDRRTRELIAIGASVTANCQPCLEYHTGKALENGASEQDIMEAIGVGKIIRRGAASKMDTFSQTVVQRAPTLAGVSDRECGCSSR